MTISFTWPNLFYVPLLPFIIVTYYYDFNTLPELTKAIYNLTMHYS